MLDAYNNLTKGAILKTSMAGLSFKHDGTLSDFQQLISDIYAVPDDRLYSLWDLLVQQQRFTMRALKGIRKNDTEKIQVNLLIALSWCMAIANRLHVHVEDDLWQRFPDMCLYCGSKPCQCKSIKPTKRLAVTPNKTNRPVNLRASQKMFAEIYPAQDRTLADAGVHLAEEMGEVGEAIHNFLGKHEAGLFREVQLEIADYVSCLFGVANSIQLDLGNEFAKFYYKNCHICHNAPCSCSFAFVARLKT